MVTKVSNGCGVVGSVPLTICALAIDTSCPSYDSGFTDSAAMVTVAGAGAGPDDCGLIPYGDVSCSTDCVRSSRCRPPLKPMRPTASTTWPGTVDEKGVTVSVERNTLMPPVASWT